MKRLIFILSCTFFSTMAVSNAEQIEQQRELFVQAERQMGSASLRQVEAWLEELKDYPLQPYLQQRYLQRRLNAHTDIESFLQQHKGSPLDWPLRRPFLQSLAKAKQSERFLTNFPGSSDAELNCTALEQRLRIKPVDKQQVWQEVQALWTVGKSQPKDCDGLFKQWRQVNPLQADTVLRRIQLSAEGGDASLIRYLKTLLPANQQYLADMWLQVRKDPSVMTKGRFFPGKHVVERDILAYGLKRLIWRSPDQALKMWQRFVNDPYFTAAQRVDVQRQFAIALASKGDSRADEWMGQLPPELLDSSLAQWQVGHALRELNWPKVQKVIEQFPAELAADINWRYWLARAFEEQGQQAKADPIFRELALRRHFYGFMSAAKLGLPPSLAHTPVPVSAEELLLVQQHPAVQRAIEWLALGRMTEARREWNFLQRSVTESQKLAAAKLAGQMEWHERAIFTLADAGYWDDVELRFPLAYKDEIQRSAKGAKVDSGWAMAIARRESSFMADANSPVGARGLMQIMPATANDIAKKRVQIAQLYNPTTNIDYGTDYLNYLMKRNDGNLIMATAAYNAGYSRVRQWIPKDHALPVDVWVETIPYRETREYVKAVMAYYQIYNIRLNEPIDVFQPLVAMQIGAKSK
ncbi:transglycosylase SLT domain-containing protein [Rheinheimera sp. UJ63]|uniref:transglycosylase SLT domain-containing protein n=1 Tax=Rheinheimera sp. UJ63 TaxID=2910157 RepID=UPI001F35495B|nr:transglycosylase SLT domain-containing protein [Rheinheimera sp. UJ63]MCF4008944.1 transglycosylase SLT domain-containing protein [Rheinheimera sp. UJ63]